MSILTELRKRKPAQEDFQGLDTLMSDADAIDAEALILEGKEPIADLEVSEDITNFQPQQVMDRDLRSALIDAFVGGAPSLLGMIGGGSAAYNTMNLEKGSEYLKKRAQDEANQKLVQLKSVDGTPYLEKEKYAVGMEPYIAKKEGSGRKYGLGGIKEFEKIGNPDETVFASYDLDLGQFVDSRTNAPLDMANYQPKQTTKNYTYKDKYENIVNTPISRGGSVKGSTILSEGEGAEFSIPVTKIRDAEKRSSDYVKRSSKYQDDLSLLDYGEKVLSDKNSSPQEKKLAIGNIIKSVESRMTDSDRSEYKGEASIFSRLGDLLDMASNNEIPPRTVQAFLDASRNLKNKINSTSGKYRESIIKSYAGNDKNLSSFISERLKPISTGVPRDQSQPRRDISPPRVIQTPKSKIMGETEKQFSDRQLRQQKLREEAIRRGLIK